MAFPTLSLPLALFSLILASIAAVLLRLHHVLDPKRPKVQRHRRKEATHLLIVLGSGGHSAEMIAMLARAMSVEDESQRLQWRDYTYRTWVVGSGDTISARRAREFEEWAATLEKESGDVNGKLEGEKEASHRIVTVPRAREIHQTLLTTPTSCLRCLIACWTILLPSPDVDFPDLILCNGPATATILVFTSILLRFFNVGGCDPRGKMRTVYVESWARVQRLSLSGRLMLGVVDRFFVQWPQLVEKTGGRGEFLGVLL